MGSWGYLLLKRKRITSHTTTLDPKGIAVEEEVEEEHEQQRVLVLEHGQLGLLAVEHEQQEVLAVEHKQQGLLGVEQG